MKINWILFYKIIVIIGLSSWTIFSQNSIKTNVSIETKNEIKKYRKIYDYHQDTLFKVALNEYKSDSLFYLLGNYNFNSKLGVYNFVHASFVPLIYSFDVKDSIGMNFFMRFFTLDKLKFVVQSKSINPMEKTQYMYINLEYIRRHESSDILIIGRNKEILQIIEKTLLREWKEDKGQIWSDEPFDYLGRKSRVASILLNKIPSQPGKSYFSAINDFELFCLIAGCSLAANQLKNKAEINPEIEEFIVYMLQILKTQCKTYDDGRWLLQPGIWKDYSDYLYAGNTKTGKNLTIAKVDTISWDASHSARWPIFIQTLKSLFKTTSTENEFLTSYQKGLADQFMNKVVHQTDSIPRFNNFMDGWNGIYRYNYSTMKQGYAPFTCNKHIFLSWWKILGDSRINQLYKTIDFNYDFYQKEYKGEIKRQKQLFKLLISLN
jgi:hypothetical protein